MPNNNAAERALRGFALGRKSWLFAGSERAGQRAAAMYSLIVTAKMNDLDPQAWLAECSLESPSIQLISSTSSSLGIGSRGQPDSPPDRRYLRFSPNAFPAAGVLHDPFRDPADGAAPL
jgi:hypothetical protein